MELGLELAEPAFLLPEQPDGCGVMGGEEVPLSRLWGSWVLM